MKKQIGLIGLGKMGGSLALQLMEKGWEVIGYNRSPEKTDSYAQKGLIAAYSLKELCEKLEGPRIIWSMLPAGAGIDEAFFGENGLINFLEKGDIVVEAANSFYQDAARRGATFQEKGIRFLDAGVSGGPGGARNGACLMVGGDQETFDYLKPLFQDVAREGAVAFFPGLGAGHYVKMVHNGIEYGMMQAIGEGFEVMKKSPYNLNLTEVSRIYNQGSVIESRLVGWLHKAYQENTEELNGISGSVKHSGEGEWTVLTAKDEGVPIPVIKASFDFRVQSTDNPSYTGKVVSALRNQFGGHDVKE
jgi:6-phosphogluconate dehydrogenase